MSRKKNFSTPDENSQIFWLGSGIFHLLVPLVHFHLQYRNEIFIQDYYLFELLDQLDKQTNKNIPIWRYSFQHEVIFHLFVPKGSHTRMLEFSWLVCISLTNPKLNMHGRVSVQGLKSLGGHFACLCRGFEFYYFSNRKWKYFYTFYNFFSEKSLKTAK